MKREVGRMKEEIGKINERKDYVKIKVKIMESKKKEINDEKMSTMKNTSRIINTSRGGVIDEDALYEFLKDGKLGGAALDVFEVEPATSNKLASLPNFISTPHMGAQTKEAQSLAANVIAEKIIQILRGVT